MEKLTVKDFPVFKGKIEVDCIMVDNKPINITSIPFSRVEDFCTHLECKSCGQEFPKEYNRSYCLSCLHNMRVDSYNKLELVEWDGNTPLVIYKDDQYFYSEDEILEFCEEQECKPSDLMLVVCNCSNLSQIDLDQWQDEVHEDWEPSDELVKKLKEFNDFLANESSQTFFEGNKRVCLKHLD